MRRFLAFIGILALLLPNLASAAVAFDASSVSTAGCSSPCSWNHTDTGSNGVLILALELEAAGSTTPAVTYNGTTMNLLENQSVTNAPFGTFSCWLFYLTAPTTGTHAISVTLAGQFIDAVASSYTGASQGTYTNHASAQPAGAAITGTLNGVASGSWTFMMGNMGSNGGLSAGTGLTQRGSTVTNLMAGDSNASVSGTVHMTINAVNAHTACWQMVEIPAFAAASAFVPSLSRLILFGDW